MIPRITGSDARRCSTASLWSGSGTPATLPRVREIFCDSAQVWPHGRVFGGDGSIVVATTHLAGTATYLWIRRAGALSGTDGNLSARRPGRAGALGITDDLSAAASLPRPFLVRAAPLRR